MEARKKMTKKAVVKTTQPRQQYFFSLYGGYIPSDSTNFLNNSRQQSMANPAFKREWLKLLENHDHLIGLKDIPTIKDLPKQWS